MAAVIVPHFTLRKLVAEWQEKVRREWLRGEQGQQRLL